MYVGNKQTTVQIHTVFLGSKLKVMMILHTRSQDEHTCTERYEMYSIEQRYGTVSNPNNQIITHFSLYTLPE